MKAIPAIWICLSQSISNKHHPAFFHVSQYNDVAVVVEVSNDSTALTPKKILGRVYLLHLDRTRPNSFFLSLNLIYHCRSTQEINLTSL